jgi:uncharacterized SAM-binding protein YcdF (DUF218 family)
VASRRTFLLKSLLVLTTVIAILVACAGLWLPAMGRALVYDDGPAKADIAVVLAGDYTGARVMRGGDLVHQGFVPSAIVSGPPGFYGVNEADAAIQYVTRQGCPAEWFIALKHSALSTRDEAEVVLDELKRRGIHSFLLVTSNFHTRRARRIFLAAEKARGGGPAMRMVSTPDREYDPASWWRTRQGRKIAFLEWTKTVTAVFGI